MTRAAVLRSLVLLRQVLVDDVHAKIGMEFYGHSHTSHEMPAAQGDLKKSRFKSLRRAFSCV